ncbi:MAG TPA: hypothetical protein VD866_18995, partial [Urbifossiella sp.]|nr:hypothetical protein [Urbifossiella sp.]
VQLFRSLNDSRALPLDVTVKAPQPTRVYAVVQLPLASYGLQPGDEITLFARAEDNDPAGPNGAESAAARVRIVSREEFEKLVRVREVFGLLQSKYQQARRRAEGLAAAAEELRRKHKDRPPAGAATADYRKDLQQLADRARAEAAAVREAAKRPLGYDLDRHLAPQLERLARQLDDAARELEEAARQGGLTAGLSAEALERLAARLNGEKAELDRNAIAPLERLAVVLPLMEDSARFVGLARRQRDLETRLRPLREQENVGDPAARTRVRDLKTEQGEVRTALAKLLDDIEDHVARLPDDPELETLRTTATDVRGSGATEAMTAAEAALAEFSGKRGHGNADRAAEILEKFVERSEGAEGIMGQGQQCLRFQPTLAAGLGNTVGQLLAESGGGASTPGPSSAGVGLYGNLPGLGSSSGAGPVGGSGDGRGDGQGGVTRTGPGPAAPGCRPPGASGASDAAVPAAYRRRVAEYFQRVADETGGR